jgi:hypothetical protein
MSCSLGLTISRAEPTRRFSGTPRI